MRSNNFFFKFGIVGDFFSFLWHKKRWCLIPAIAFLIVIGFNLIFPQSSAIGPFVYSQF